MGRTLRTLGMMLTLLLACASARGAESSQAIKISAAWARASAPSADVGAAYATLLNQGAQMRRLVGASSAAAEAVELHETTMEGDIMKMRPLEAIALAPGEEVKLEPGGMHMMFIGLKGPFVADTQIPLALRFDDGTTMEISVPVRALGAETAHGQGEHDHGSSQMKHHEHDGHGTMKAQ